MNEKYINFEVEDAELLATENDSEFLTASVDAFSTGLTRNNTDCDLEALQTCASTIYEKPILFTINKNIGDFYTHVDPDETLIAGFVVPDSATFRENNGRTTLNVKAKIWARYAQKFVEVFKDTNTKKKKVSVEAKLLDYDEEPDGFVRMRKWIFSGICVLSDLITEASIGANLVLNFAEENEKIKRAYISEFGTKYDSLDFSIPSKVKQNSQKGLDLRKQHGYGGTSVSLATAKYLVKNSQVTPEKAKNISKYFQKHKNDKLEEKTPPSREHIGWLLQGGTEGWRWSEGLVKKLEEIDNRNASYFGLNLTFPYESLKDINPALKGIEPPITLGQANEIARQADAIGADKGGWGIAIKHFKDTHKVVDGRWVKEDSEKKENMAVEDEKEKIKEEEMAEKEPEKEEKMAEETPEAEDKEEKEEEEKGEEGEEDKEKKEEKMSLDANLDVAAILKFLEEETEDYQELVGMTETGNFMNYGVNMCGKMYAKMCKMASEYQEMCGRMAKMEEESKTYMGELEELRKFKADIEQKQFSFEVDYTLKEVEKDMPKEELKALFEESKNFTLKDIEGWKNLVKARAFTFSKGKKENEDGIKIGFPFVNQKSDKKKSLWD